MVYLVNFSLAYSSDPDSVKIQQQTSTTLLTDFLVMLIPFFIVNGVLTGSWIVDQVVWYNDTENLGLRISTIPIEDGIYAYS
ncbi:MAG: hypothetical protein CM15mP58_18850 [Burkholderiaceae bacterium]|nr:MAG: hypothetical protein CM15mP58_18850 [Burkholderiaceae bacterium]